MRKKTIKIIFLLMIILMLIIPSKVIASSKIKLGDINSDTKIDTSDILIVLRHISAKKNNNHSEWILSEEKLKIADITEDGEVDSRDMLAMLRYIVVENNEKIKEKHPEWGVIKEIEVEPTQKQKTDTTKVQENIKEEKTKETVQEESLKKESIKQETEKKEIQKEQLVQEKKTEPVVEATGVSLKNTSISLDIEESMIIEAKISPVNTTNKKLTFSSNNTNIATVEQVTVKGTYYIKTKINDKVLSVEDSKETNSAKIQVNDNKKIESQKYDLIDIGNGYYLIRARHSGKVLDVQNANKVNRTQVIQYDLNGNDNQLWKLEDAGDGYYYIKSKHSGLYLDIQGGKAKEGDKIIIYAGNKKDNQKFKLDKTGDETNDQEVGIAKIKAKNRGTALITATTSNGKTATCNVKVSIGGYGYTGKKAQEYYFRQTDKKWHSYFFGTWNGKKYQLNQACGCFAITHCIGIMTEKYDKITPDLIAAQIRKQSGTNNIAGDTKKMKNVVKLYGFDWQPMDYKDRNANGLKAILKNGGTLWGSLRNGDYYYKPNGKRAMNNGHAVMWYKYEDGYFYAKDSARDGGGACKYPEKELEKYLKRGYLSVIKKK